jgi:hypothetical protein
MALNLSSASIRETSAPPTNGAAGETMIRGSCSPVGVNPDIAVEVSRLQPNEEAHLRDRCLRPAEGRYEAHEDGTTREQRPGGALSRTSRRLPS